jgi:hypothetical protein
VRKFFLLPAFCFLFFTARQAAGLDLEFGWGLGEVGVHYGPSPAPIDASLFLGRFGLLVNKNFGLELQLIGMEGVTGKPVVYSLLPLEAEYRLINLLDAVYIGPYGKAAWRFTRERGSFNPFVYTEGGGFYSGAGLKFRLSIPLALRYKADISLFAEYGFPGGFKAGIKMDLLFLLFLL